MSNYLFEDSKTTSAMFDTRYWSWKPKRRCWCRPACYW